MRNNRRYDKDQGQNVKMAKATILFIITVIFVVGGSALIALKFSESRQAIQEVQATEVNNSNDDVRDNNGQDSKVTLLENDPTAEDAAYVEKYLNQQMKGQMPDGADGKKVAYLTFDDGPSETVTPQILDILKAENVKATFFIIGRYIDKNEASKNLVKRAVEEGNAIGIHSYSHDYKYLFPDNKINLENCMADFEKTDQSIKNVLGQDFATRAIRFPGGLMTWTKNDQASAEAVEKELNEKDWHQIDWNSLTGESEAGAKKNAEQLTQEVIKTVGKREKAIILMHDNYGKEETAKALPAIIKYLKEQGYEFKSIK
jgi:peptidoglycan/xylan/chitin deacetylase (PgdA/CDA1 family)